MTTIPRSSSFDVLLRRTGNWWYATAIVMSLLLAAMGGFLLLYTFQRGILVPRLDVIATCGPLGLFFESCAVFIFCSRTRVKPARR